MPIMRDLSLFLRRYAKIGYVEWSATVTGMFLEADDALFRRILYKKTHVLHTYLPEKPQIIYSLPTKTHNKSLICKTSDLNEHNFIVRSLYKDCYWLLFHFSALYIFTYVSMYTKMCPEKKRGSTFDIITLEKHARFL